MNTDELLKNAGYSQVKSDKEPVRSAASTIDITICDISFPDKAVAEGHHDLHEFAMELTALRCEAVRVEQCRHAWGYLHIGEDEDTCFYRIHKRRTPRSIPLTIWEA